MPPLTVAWDARLVGGTHTGDTSYWTGLLHGLTRLPDDVRVLLFHRGEAPFGLSAPNRFQWIRVPAQSARWWSLVAFPLAARRHNADVFHAQYNVSPLAGSRAVATVHDVSFFIGPEWFRPRDRFLLRRFVPATVRRVARVLTVSETSRREIERHIPQAMGKVLVTPNALGPGFQPWEREAAARHVAGRFLVDRPFVLSVGTRWPRKNAQLAIDATRNLPDSTPHLLVLAGHPGWGGLDRHQRVKEVGYVDDTDLASLYAAADLYLAPSRHEGFGIPLLEAWASRCPVLCSQGGALPETAGDAAEVEPSWEPSDWAAAIQRLLDDPERLDALRARGTERLKCFDWRKTAELTLAAYREAAA